MHRYTVGIDWAQMEHAVCVVDAQGKVKSAFSVPHTREGLAELPVAIERPSGLLVDALVEAGHPVVPIHPNALEASRPRYRAAGGKSDPGDAFMLADLLRTDGHRFRALRPLSDEIRALRASVRGRDELVAERVALGNQLTALLESFWPGAAGIFADVTSPIALAFLDRYPTPESAARLGEKRLSFPRAGKVNAAQMLAEIGDDPLRFPTADRLAAEAGVAPVTHASGKHRAVAFRWACNKRLRAALTTFADNSRHASPWAAHVYTSARGRGCDHPHAIRILARAWTRVLWRAWTDGQPYDPARHQAAQQLPVAA